MFIVYFNLEIVLFFCSLEVLDLREYRVVIIFCMMSDNLVDFINVELSM